MYAEYLLSVIFTLNGINSRAGLSRRSQLKLGILTEPTGVTEKRILLIIVDGSGGRGRRGREDEMRGRKMRIGKRREEEEEEDYENKTKIKRQRKGGG